MRGILKNTNGSVVLLLGAGASVDAGIFDTTGMIKELNSLLKEGEVLESYNELYNSLKKLYGKKNIEDNKLSFDDLNIEKLVSILEDLVSLLDGNHSLSPLFEPLIAIFQSMYGFKEIKKFKNEIEERLINWITPNNLKVEYFKSVLKFVKENTGSGLRLFTLNYDRCIETAFEDFGIEYDIKLERGFGKEKQGVAWEAKNFEEIEEKETGDKKTLFLYKLHGSIDWDRNKKQELIRANRPSIKECIFGNNFKVRTYDPFLYFTYQFRTSTLNSKIIIVCGYNFGDKHINDILHQALTNEPDRRILICSYLSDENRKSYSDDRLKSEEEEKKEYYKSQLVLEDSNQIEVILGKAGYFFDKTLNMNYLENLLPEEDIENLFYQSTIDEEIIQDDSAKLDDNVLLI